MEENITTPAASDSSESKMEVRKINVEIIDGGTDGSNIKTKKKNRLLAFLKSKRSYFFAFIIPALILLGAYAAFKVWPIGDMSVLVLDLNGQYVYYFEHLRDIVHGKGSPFISWSRNLTGELMGIYAYYLASPFTVIPMLLPRSAMTEALLIMQLCKVGTASVTFNFYLRRSKGCKSSTALVFGMLYSLMGYMVVQLMNPMWLDGLIYLPLIVYGIEKIIDRNSWTGFIIPLALMYMANFYIGWMITFFSVIYFIYYYFAGKKEYTFSVKSFLFAGIKFAVGGIVAAAAACWVLLPLYHSLKLGKFDFSTPNYELKTQFEFTDFFKNLLPNTYDTCRPEGSPVVYCGVLTVILIPLFFLNGKIRFRHKAGMSGLLAAVLASMYLSTADIAWHGFQVPNWLPYRYSFTFSFVLLVMAAMTFERLEGITVKDIGVTAFGLMAYVFYVGKQDFDGVTLVLTVWYTVVFTLVYSIFLRYIKLSNRVTRAVLTFIMGLFVVGELFGSSLSTMHAINSDVTYSKHSGYNRIITLARDTVSKIYAADSFDGGGAYRIEKNYHRTVNDPMVIGSYGISHSSSTLNSGPIQFLRRLGFSYGGHYIRYKGSTYVSDAVLGIKYVMEKGSSEDEALPVNKHYDDLLLENRDSKDVFAVYENPYALPVAFMADRSVLGVTFESDNPFNNQNTLMSHLVSNEETEYFKRITVSGTFPENARQSSYGAHTKYTPIEEGKNCHIEYILNAPTDDMIYMYLPSSYERQVNLWLNKEFLDYYFENGKMVIQTLGRFEEGEEISLIVTVTEDKKEVLFKDKLFYYLDEEKFAEDIEKLRQGGLRMTSFEEDHITGTITAEKDGIMFTTVSWEPGWTIKVDGAVVTPVKVCDALIGVELSAGEHEIEMTFFPAGLKAGIIISIAAVIIVIIIAVTEKRTDKILLDRLN